MREERELERKLATSRHLERLAEHVQAGAHVVLRGHVRDDVLVAGRVVEESWGIAHVLAERIGINRVFVSNQADGTFCVDPEEENSAAEFFARLDPVDRDHPPTLHRTDPFEIASAIRMLLRQDQRPVAVILEDPAALFASTSRDESLALSILLEGMTEAAYVRRRGDVPVRNTLIVYGSPDGPALEAMTALPGVEEVPVEAPNYSERLSALRDLRKGFYHAGNGARPSRENLKVLASLTDGSSLQAVRRLTRASHALATPASRPETLFRRSRGETTLTPLGKVGVKPIMRQLGEEVLGQDPSLAVIKSKLELGRWRPANRAPGARLTRPMATLVMHGPPGVGKTETALILAEAMLGSRGALVRIDCSEMRNPHDIARLTGAPPGYVGYSEGGALTEALERDSAVILFDEFDRAHAGLTETLLGILDAGRLTDGRGRTATFENALLLFTTNLGFREKENPGFSYEDPPGRDDFVAGNEKRLEKTINNGSGGTIGSPALWSRLRGSLVGYDLLRRPAVEAIVRNSCERLAINLNDEFDVQLSFEADLFAADIGEKRDREPKWDGRRVFREVQALIEGGARERLHELEKRGRLPAGAKLRFVPDASGRAKLAR